jgi:hypothetical protein
MGDGADTKKDEIFNMASSPSILPASAAEDVATHKNFALLNEPFCGKTLKTKRIVGGIVASVFEFPWLVLLQYRSTDDENITSWKCGGTLISKRYVLTG